MNDSHPLVKEVQEKTSLQDLKQVTQYTQQALDMIKQKPIPIHKGLNHYLGALLEALGILERTK